jgi:4-amino-4-deoxy-L-arabinose transferase-like glycosyltransferase
MKLNRPVSWFLVAFGVWSWIVWTTFVKNLWKDASGLAFVNGDHSRPTAYFWIHLTLAVVSFLLGTAIGGIGVRSLLVLRREAASGSGASGLAGSGSAGASGGTSGKAAGRADRAA